MSRGLRVRLTLFLTVMAWVFALPAAHAYIDPASSSMILSAVVAGVAAIGTGFAVFWNRLKALFGKGPAATATDGPSASDTDESDHAAEQV